MKKSFARLMSGILTLVMVMTVIPSLPVVAADQTPLIIDFEKNSYDSAASPLKPTWSSTTVTVVDDPLSKGKGKVLQAEAASTLSLDLNVKDWPGNATKDGVLTYKFDVYSPELDPGIKSGSTDGTTISTLAHGGGYSYITDESSTWAWETNGTSAEWTTMTLVFDFAKSKYTIKAGDTEGHTASIIENKIGGAKDVSDPFGITFRCSAGTGKYLYLDNVNVTYEVPQELTINFENNSYNSAASPLKPTWSSTTVTVVDDPLSTGRGKVLQAEAASTLSLDLNVKNWPGNTTKDGVLTYKFDVYSPELDPGIKSGSTDGTTISTLAHGGGYSYITDESSTWAWETNGTSAEWTTMTLVFDFANSKYTIKAGDTEGHTASIIENKIGGAKDVSDPFGITFRCSAGTGKYLYLDNIDVNYAAPGETTPEPGPGTNPDPDPDPGQNPDPGPNPGPSTPSELSINFENNTYDEATSLLTNTWDTSAFNQVVDDPLYTERGKVLKFGSTSTVASLDLNVSSWPGNTARNGVLTYKFDLYNPDPDVAIKMGSTDGGTMVSISHGGSFAYETPSDGKAWVYDAMNSGGWNTVTMKLDFVNSVFKVQIANSEEYSTPIVENKVGSIDVSNAFKIAFRCAVSDTYFYLDNIDVTFVETKPEVGEITHSWLDGIKVPFSIAMKTAEVEADGNITLNDVTAGGNIPVVVDYDTAAKTATVVPTVAIDPSHSFTVTVSKNIASTINTYAEADTVKPIVLESLDIPAITENGITLFDTDGTTPPISRIEKIKAKFNVPMNEASLETAGNVTLVKEIDGSSVTLTSVNYDINDDNSVTIVTASELEPGSKYILTFTTNVERVDGEALTTALTAEIDAPVLEKPGIVTENVKFTDKLGTTDKMDAIKKNITSINVPFDMPMDSTTMIPGNMTFTNVTGGSSSPVTFFVVYNVGTQTAVITPSTELAPGNEYKITFKSDVKAQNGESVDSENDELSFTTAVLDRPVVATIEGSADGSNYAAIENVADVIKIKAEFNYKMKNATVTASTVKLEKFNGTDWVDAGAAFAFDGNKTVTFTLGSGTFPEGANFRIRCANTVSDIYEDKMTADTSEYTKAFTTKMSAVVTDLNCTMRGKTLTYSGKLMSGTTPVANEKMSMLIYKQGGAPVPFGAGTKHFTILTTGTDGGFSGTIDLYDAESAEVFEELWVAFDAQSMGVSNQLLSKAAVQLTNSTMDETSIADLKASPKDVFTYVTEAANSATMSAIVPANGLTAVQNQNLYKGMGVWVDKYNAMTPEEKAAANASLATYKSTLTTDNAAKILNASLIAADYVSLSASDAVADLTSYNDTIEEVKVEATNYSQMSATSKTWVAQNIKTNNPSGFANYEEFTKEVKKSMLLDMISSTTYTELADLFINNKALVNDGLGENKLATLEAATNQDKIDAAMQSIKLQNAENKFSSTAALANAIALAIQNTPGTGGGTGGGGSFGGGGGAGGGSGSVNDSFSIGGLGGNAAENTVTKEVFTDLAGFEWAKDAILSLYNRGVVSGIGANKYEPGRSVTREEFVKLICEAFGFETSNKEIRFKDVKADEWYAKYIQGAVELGVINGISDTEFGIGRMITREDMAVIILRALKAKGRNIGSARKSFADKSEISGYALDAVELLSGMGIINGVGGNNYAPKNNATRAEAAVIINRCLQ